jgi:hypothetical protein
LEQAGCFIEGVTMGDKRMLIVPADLIEKINANRGDMSQAEFIDFLIEGQLEKTKQQEQEDRYVTKEELQIFETDIKELLKIFLDFFVSYGLDLGKKSPKSEFEELSSKLHELETELASEGESKEAKIKWK